MEPLAFSFSLSRAAAAAAPALEVREGAAKAKAQNEQELTLIRRSGDSHHGREDEQTSADEQTPREPTEPNDRTWQGKYEEDGIELGIDGDTNPHDPAFLGEGQAADARGEGPAERARTGRPHGTRLSRLAAPPDPRPRRAAAGRRVGVAQRGGGRRPRPRLFIREVQVAHVKGGGARVRRRRVRVRDPREQARQHSFVSRAGSGVGGIEEERLGKDRYIRYRYRYINF